MASPQFAPSKGVSGPMKTLLYSILFILSAQAYCVEINPSRATNIEVKGKIGTIDFTYSATATSGLKQKLLSLKAVVGGTDLNIPAKEYIDLPQVDVSSISLIHAGSWEGKPETTLSISYGEYEECTDEGVTYEVSQSVSMVFNKNGILQKVTQHRACGH